MVRAFWHSALALALMGALALAQTEDKAPDVKKEEVAPPAPAPNKPDQSGVPAAAPAAAGPEVSAAAFGNGVLTAPGASSDVDTAPSKFSTRTAADDQLATVGYRLRHLSADQKAGIYAEIARAGRATSVQLTAAVGVEIPLALALEGLRPLPLAVTGQFPELNGLACASLSGRLALIDPTMRIVVDVAAQ